MSQVQKIAAQLVKHRVKMAVLALFCLLLGSLQLGKIDVTGNLGGFDAPGVPVFEDAKQFDSLFGGVRTKVFVSVTPKKGADYSLWKECADIENGLRKLSAGIEIISPRRFVRGYYGLVDPQHEIPTVSMLRTLSTHPQLGKLISKDKSSFLLLLTFPNDSIPQKALQDWIEQPRSMIEQTRIFGLVQLESAIEETIIKDIALVSACIALFFACFIYWAYRSISAIVCAIVMMGSSIWMTFCLYALLGYQINVITILALPIILVLSLSDAIHLLSGFYHEKDLPSLLAKYMAPSLYSSVTTAVAFFSFGFSDSPFIQQLGLLTGIALLLEFLVSFAIAPWIFSKVQLGKRPPASLEGLTTFILKQKKVIATTLMVIAVGSIFLFPQLKFKSDTEAFFPKNHPITDNHNYFNDQYYSHVSCNVWFDNTGYNKPTDFLNAVNKKIAQLSQHPKVTQVSHAQASTKWEQVLPLELNADQNPFSHFINPDTSIIRCELHFANANDVIGFYQDAQKNQWLTATAMQVHVMSNTLIYDYINHNIAKTLFYSLLTSGIAIVLMLFFITKSWKQAFIGLLPNAVPLSIAVWVFSIFGFSLNILTAITATVCIGLLDDDTVHLLYRRFVLKQPVDTLANSIVNTAILLAVGFGFFLMSDFYPTQVFGGVSALVFVFGILGELTLFQVLMDWIERKGQKS